MRKKFLLLLLLIPIIYLSFTYLKPTPYLTVAGSIKMADGLGRQAVELMDTFYDDFTINFYSTGKLIATDVPKRIENLIRKNCTKRRLGRILFYEESVLISNTKSNKRLKRLGAKKPNQIRIAYSMGESSLLPSLAVERLNHTFDAIALPDPFLIEVYRNSGVTLPLFVIPLGLNLEPFLQEPLKNSAHYPFCFINLSSCEPRKNQEALILAFHKAFGNDPKVELRINCRANHDNALEKTVALINSLRSSNIILTDTKLTNEQYRDFMMQGDVLVNLSKGEGFSIQPREAMALGMPVIISNNTAHKTILQSQLATGVSCPHEEIYFNKVFQSLSGKYYLADIDEAALTMRRLYEQYEEELTMADARREWAKQYQFAQLKDLYFNMIKPKKLILGEKDEVTPEGLTTTSVALYQKYKVLTQ